MGAVLAAGAGVCVYVFPWGQGLEDWSYDLSFLSRRQVHLKDVVVITLDDPSYHALQQRPKSFDRRLHARLIDHLTQAGAKLIVFDILFIEAAKDDPEGDRLLADAIRRSHRVILAANYTETVSMGVRHAEVQLPEEPFRSAVGEQWGIAHLDRDADFGSRLLHPGTDRFPSLAWVAASTADPNSVVTSVKRDQVRWLNYYGGKPFRLVSYAEALRAHAPVAAQQFGGKVVFVGGGVVAGYAGEKKEEFRNPWTWLAGDFSLGVELHALAYANLARNDFLVRIPMALEFLGILMIGVLAGYGSCRFSPWPTCGFGLAVAAMIAGLGVLSVQLGRVWFPWLVTAVVQVPLAAGWAIYVHALRAHLRAESLRVSLARYVPRQQVAIIMNDPSLLKPGGVMREVSILFSDIASFSKFSEGLPPDELVRLLNTYYETALECVHQHEGTVIKLIGDAIFAIWNAPLPKDNHRQSACLAALALADRLADPGTRRFLPMKTRVGVHSGTACVGNVGSSDRFDYTAIGDSVNVASRLEGLNKELGTSVLVSIDLFKEVREQLSITSRTVGLFQFKGLGRSIRVFELLGNEGPTAAQRTWIERFEEALARFCNRRFDEAHRMFQQTIALRQRAENQEKLSPEFRSEDGPSRFYLLLIDRYRQSPPGDDWIGEVSLEGK